MKLAFALVVLVGLHSVAADLYMHYPPGSNDRNRERNQDRNNNNLLFNSQNNARGGYPWNGDPTLKAMPDPLHYYTGSKLRIEWDNQHACGASPNNYCQMIIQYACEDTLPGIRDGYPDSDNVVEGDNNNPGYKIRQFSGQAGQNQDGTNTIPESQSATDPVARDQFYYLGQAGGIEFPMHEGIDYYNACKSRQRNPGIYIADRQLNGADARFTRQNNNGERHGLECPEEREYYPYWVGGGSKVSIPGAPAGGVYPWIDMAILSSNAQKWCPWLTANSHNVMPYGSCSCNANGLAANNNLNPATAERCAALGSNCQWLVDDYFAKNSDLFPAPDCQQHDFGRDNHLGNSLPTEKADYSDVSKKITPKWDINSIVHQGETQHYTLQLPKHMEGKKCVIRGRYNISTGDYPSLNYLGGSPLGDFTSKQNCQGANKPSNTARTGAVFSLAANDQYPQCRGFFNETVKPLFNRPYIYVFGATNPQLSIALNSDQSARTFQDRSYVFQVDPRPSGVDGTIYNLGARGRRGNIVQTFPAVEYDFVPTNLEITDGDFIHVQFHGTTFNQALNANNGEGHQYDSKHNMVQTLDRSSNFPATTNQMNLFKDTATALRFALLDQDPNVCQQFAGTANGDNNQNDVRNCAKLNSAPYRWPQDPTVGILAPSVGTYHYIGTRNNNFSNRSQKGTIIVDPATGLTPGQTAGVVLGVLGGLGVAMGGVLFYGKRHPNTRAGTFYQKVNGSVDRCRNRGGTAYQSTSAPMQTSAPVPMDREYRRY